MPDELTDFGYQDIAAAEKKHHVARVFSAVAQRYDLMNDLMSLGAHRLWKRAAVHLSGVRRGQTVLDVAAGTADLARLFKKRVGPGGWVAVSDINGNMLRVGRDRSLDLGLVSGLLYAQADVEALPFGDDTFDCISIAFGLRNVTDKPKALESMFAKLRYGGSLVVLEFSAVRSDALRRLYDCYSLHCIPKIGKWVAGDEDAYRYLVESIRRHPNQENLKTMIENAGFSKVEYFNLSGGVVALHRARKL